MKEKDFQTRFNKWLMTNWGRGTAVFELKLARGRTLPFSAIREHQERNLLSARAGTLVYKIPDDSIGQKPFDSFLIRRVEAYLVVMFLHPSERLQYGYKKFYIIPIEKYVRFKYCDLNPPKKSITIDDAVHLGIVGFLI